VTARRRAPNGKSSISLGADGRWHTWVTVGHKLDGALDRRHVHRKTATEVAAAVEALHQRMTRGSGVVTKIETVEQWLTYWLDNVVEPGLSYNTTEDYGSLVRNHYIPNLGKWKLDGTRNRLEPEYVESMYARMRRAGISPSYVLKAHRVLRKALKDAVRRGRASRNVCDLIDPPRARRGKVDAHTLAEAQALLTAAMADSNPARWLIGLLLGPRQGEALGLRWHRVHLDSSEPYLEVVKQLQRRKWRHGCDDPEACASSRCTAKRCVAGYKHGCGDQPCGKKLAYACPERVLAKDCVRHTRACPAPCLPGCRRHASSCPQRRDGGLVEVDVKSEKGERDIPLPRVVVEQLLALRERQIVRAAEHGYAWDPRGLVFINEQGRPVHPRRDNSAWKSLLVSAGVDDSRLHAARHTAATFMLASGTDSRVVQEVLGHSRLAVTEVYMDVASDLKRQAVDRIASALMDGQLTALLQGPSVPAPRRSS
jgi:integrase